MTILATNLGFPRIGSHRELKTALESFWSGATAAEDLVKTAASLRSPLGAAAEGGDGSHPLQ
jgi:5-methyltetrahydropteroyltriglutamate--homocysteine methyltransferase